ncbi:MAG: hypothetical protein KF803_10215 [Cyclobacteriaceae bacterium]|nr:hypothetical protein [Cyclobacteriaceae bacterium]
MEKPSFFFDYIYYRITEFYFRWDGRIGVTAIAVISLMQILLFLGVAMMLNKSLIGITTFSYPKAIASFFVIGVFGLFAYNLSRYRKKYSQLKLYYNKEKPNVRTIKGFLIILLFICCWLQIIIISNLI